MRQSAAVAVFPLFLLTLFFPLVVIVMLWRCPRRPLAAWLASLILATGVVGFSVLVAPWGWLGVPVRYGLATLFVIAVAMSLLRAVSPETKSSSPLRLMMKVILGLLFGGVALGALRGREVPPAAIELAFPLRGGRFLVAHGGSSGQVNTYNPHPTRRYAVDLVKLNAFGARASGLLPRQPDRYAIFGADVVSPCDGTIVVATDGIVDASSSPPDPKTVDGNSVVVQCGPAKVTLAHLQRGSVLVRAGAVIVRSQPLARVGSSGQSGEPHLHLWAERDGKPVPMTFDGEWLVRNDVVRR